MKKKAFFLILPFVLWVLLLITAKAFLFFMDVTHYVCPVYLLYGLYCPGCGGTRAVKALLDGNILLSLKNNPSVIIGAVFCIAIYIRLLINVLTEKNKKIIPGGKAFYLSAAGIIIVYYVLRNLIPSLQPV